MEGKRREREGSKKKQGVWQKNERIPCDATRRDGAALFKRRKTEMGSAVNIESNGGAIGTKRSGMTLLLESSALCNCLGLLPQSATTDLPTWFSSGLSCLNLQMTTRTGCHISRAWEKAKLFSARSISIIRDHLIDKVKFPIRGKTQLRSAKFDLKYDWNWTVESAKLYKSCFCNFPLLFSLRTRYPCVRYPVTLIL